MSDLSTAYQNGTGKNALTVALIGPHDQRRRAFGTVLSQRGNVTVQEFTSYPAELEHLPKILIQHYNVIVIDAESDPEAAFNLAETVCGGGHTAVMAYSSQADVKQAIRFMRIGVREFFTFPFDTKEVSDALARAAEQEPVQPKNGRSVSRVFVFLGTKGGCGVTALASNFAIALMQESERSTLLIDLGLPLGDAAINLGMTTEFSVANALQDTSRLDGNFLRTLLANHASGLSVLAAPSDFRYDPRVEEDAINKLLSVARQSFENVVIDAGTRIDLLNTSIFEESSTVYLVTQVGISELRNANRMITQFFSRRADSLQIVLNRYKPGTLLFDDKHIEKALTRPMQWRIPDDWASARRTQNTATAMALDDSPISLAIRQMARAAYGITAEKEEKKRLFGLFR